MKLAQSSRPSAFLSACILGLHLCAPAPAQHTGSTSQRTAAPPQNTAKSSQITPYDYGAVYSDASVDESTALRAAVNASLATGLPLDLAGGKWRIDSTIEAVGDLHLRNGSIHTNIGSNFGLAILPASPAGYVSPTIENVTFHKIQQQGVVGLWIQRGHHVQMRSVNFTNFRNGESTALLLEQVQVLSWFGGFLTENDRHMAVSGGISTDLKIYGVWFQDSKSSSYAGVTLEGVAGVTFSGCSFDIARSRSLLSLSDSKNISFVDTRFEKPSYPGQGLLPDVSYPAVELNGDSVNIRFMRNYFSNTQVTESGGNQAEVVRIDPLVQGNIVLIANTFPASSPPITSGGTAELQYRALMNTGLADH